MVSLAEDLTLALDRVAFAEELGISPDPWQEDLVRSGSDRVMLNITRQGGKSTMSAVIALHRALYRPGSLVLCLAPAERQSKELFSKITAFYRTLHDAPPPDSDRKLGMHLANGSRIEALPGSERTIRGFSGVDLLVVDEAARVDDGLVYAIKPMLAVSGGRLLMLSTPYGRRGIFHKEWTEGTGWKRFEVPASECPRRVYEVRQDVETSYDVIRLDRVPLRTSYTKVATGLVKLLKEFHRAHTEAADYNGKAVTVGLAVDEGGVGRAVRDIVVKEIEESIERGRPRVRFLPVTVTGGTATTTGQGWVHVPKRDLISAGLVAYQNGLLRVGRLRHRDTLENELKNYRLRQNIATGHTAFEPLRSGQHDDLLFAVCLGVWSWEQATPKEKYLRFPNQILAH